MSRLASAPGSLWSPVKSVQVGVRGLGQVSWGTDERIAQESRGMPLRFTEILVSPPAPDQKVQTSASGVGRAVSHIFEHHFLARLSAIQQGNQLQVNVDFFGTPYWEQQDRIICRIG